MNDIRTSAGSKKADGYYGDCDKEKADFINGHELEYDPFVKITDLKD